MKKIYKALVVSGAIMPMIVFAQDLNALITKIQTFINRIIPFIIGLAGLVFFWGIFQFVINAGDEEKRKEGRTYIIYALIGIVVMVSFWGIINIAVNSLGLTESQNVTVPSIRF